MRTKIALIALALAALAALGAVTAPADAVHNDSMVAEASTGPDTTPEPVPWRP